MAANPLPDPLLDLLKRSETIAVVGLSDSPLRPSHGVSAYMQIHGYRIIPVNPNIREALGEPAYLVGSVEHRKSGAPGTTVV